MSQPSWQEAAAGLDTHRSGVLLRIVVMIGAVLYMATTMMSSTYGEGWRALALLIGLGELCATGIALVGVVRFGGKADSRARSMASFASFALIAVIVAQIYALWIGYRLFEASAALAHGNPFAMEPSRDLLEHVERLPYINIGAGIAGMLAILTVLGSLTAVGHALADDNLVRRSRRTTIAVVILGVAYGLILSWAAGTVHTSEYVVLAVIGALAVYGLGVLFAYIGVLTMASDAMRSGAVAMPAAHVRQS